MGQGILLSQGAEVDFMIHGVFSYHLFGQELWITTTHICTLIVGDHRVLHCGEPGSETCV